MLFHFHFYGLMPLCFHSISISYILFQLILFSFICVIFYRHNIIFTHALRHLEVICICRSPRALRYCSAYCRKGVNAWYKYFIFCISVLFVYFFFRIFTFSMYLHFNLFVDMCFSLINCWRFQITAM